MLTHTGTYLSQMIKRYTQSDYSHVSLSLNKELTEVYSFGRKNPKNPLFAGFVKEDIKNGTYSLFTETTCQVYSMKVSDVAYERIVSEVERFNERKEDYHYSLMGVFTAAVNIPLERENFYFCSQFVSHILKQAGIELFDKPCSLVRPAHFLNAPNLHLEYEGKLSEYPFSNMPCEDISESNRIFI